MNWDLSELFSGLHAKVHLNLNTARHKLGHPGAIGDASETAWCEMLQSYLPKRYQVATAFVVDSEGTFSEQIDVVIFDRQYSPLVFEHKGQVVIPAESVYGVFEAKQTMTAALVGYAMGKAASVRNLRRTSLPVPHVSGIADPKAPGHILAGILSLSSDWNPPLGAPLREALATNDDDRRLDLGCAASYGWFRFQKKFNVHELFEHEKAATAFLLGLISELQRLATVPMIDIDAYAKWL